MKLTSRIWLPLALLITFLLGCASKLVRSDSYTNENLQLNLKFPGYYTFDVEKGKLSGFTKKTFNSHIKEIDEKPTEKILFYARSADKPNNIPYTAIGSLFPEIDTTKVKANGFFNRTINTQPYLHKTGVDRARKIVSSEYLVKLDSGFFYLFAYAPINTLINNEEDIIIAQDSLNRKYSGVIGSMKK